MATKRATLTLGDRGYTPSLPVLAALIDVARRRPAEDVAAHQCRRRGLLGPGRALTPAGRELLNRYGVMA